MRGRIRIRPYGVLTWERGNCPVTSLQVAGGVLPYAPTAWLTKCLCPARFNSPS